jgi:hypothetical protein
VERVTVQPSDRSSVIQPQSVQPDSKPPAEIVQPIQAPSPVPTSVSSASPRIPVSTMPQRASPNPAGSPMSPVNPRRVSFGPAPASPAPDQPVAASPAPVHKPPTPVKKYGRSRRGQIPNRQMGPYQVNSVSLNKVYSVDLNPQTMDDVKWLHVNNLVSDHDRNKNLFVMMGAHDDHWGHTAMQITLELALKRHKLKHQLLQNVPTFSTSRRSSISATRVKRRRPYILRYFLAAW